MNGTTFLNLSFLSSTIFYLFCHKYFDPALKYLYNPHLYQEISMIYIYCKFLYIHKKFLKDYLNNDYVQQHIDLSTTDERPRGWLNISNPIETRALRLVLWNLMAILFHGLWEKSFLLINWQHFYGDSNSKNWF